LVNHKFLNTGIREMSRRAHEDQALAHRPLCHWQILINDRLGTDTIDALSKQTGVGHEDLLAGLSKHLPDLVDQLSPNGRLPTAEEASRMV
jgi:YidB-like protein